MEKNPYRYRGYYYNRETAKVVGDTVPTGGCFVAETRVKTKEGYRNIEDIRIGNLVYAKNPDTGETGYKAVT